MWMSGYDNKSTSTFAGSTEYGKSGAIMALDLNKQDFGSIRFSKRLKVRLLTCKFKYHYILIDVEIFIYLHRGGVSGIPSCSSICHRYIQGSAPRGLLVISSIILKVGQHHKHMIHHVNSFEDPSRSGQNI